MPQCCAIHADPRSLWQHLASEYSEVVPERIANELVRAREAVKLFGGAPDDMRTIALLTRAQLDLITGRAESVARLEPQPHPARAGKRG